MHHLKSGMAQEFGFSPLLSLASEGMSARGQERNHNGSVCSPSLAGQGPKVTWLTAALAWPPVQLVCRGASGEALLVRVNSATVRLHTAALHRDRGVWR